MKKYPMSFRLTKQAQELLKKMSDLLGISQVAVIELAVREKAEKVIVQNVRVHEENSKPAIEECDS